MSDNEKKPLAKSISDALGVGEASKEWSGVVRDVLDTWLGPIKTVKQAEAEVQAGWIKQNPEFAVAKLKEAGNFSLAGKLRGLGVIKGVFEKATPHLNKDADPKRVHSDFYARFFDKCQHTSDEEMQELWAKILAGEINQPSSFSPKTLEVLSVLTRTDAEAFKKLCAFVAHGFASDGEMPLVLDPNSPIYASNGCSYSVLKHLDFLGLAIYDASGTAIFFSPQDALVSLTIYGKNFLIVGKLPQGQTTLPVGQVSLTRAGLDLLHICDIAPVAEFPDYVIDWYKTRGIIFERMG